MKKIKYFLLTVAISFGVSGCYTDDAINKVTIQGLQDITLSIATTNSLDFTAERFDIPYTAVIPNVFSSDVTVETTLKYQGGEVLSYVTIPAGSTSRDGTVQKSDDGSNLPFNGFPVSLSLTGLSVSGAQAGEPSVFNITSNDVNLTAFDRIQWPYGSATIAGRMTALFDWGDPGANDLDMLMFRDDFTLVEIGATGSRWETDIFNDTHADGNYFIAIDFWIASGDIPWKLWFVHPDQVTVTSFEGTFTGAASGDFIFPLINFTKSTDPGTGEVSYTFSQP
jgi:hypothetical protein